MVECGGCCLSAGQSQNEGSMACPMVYAVHGGCGLIRDRMLIG